MECWRPIMSGHQFIYLGFSQVKPAELQQYAHQFRRQWHGYDIETIWKKKKKAKWEAKDRAYLEAKERAWYLNDQVEDNIGVLKSAEEIQQSKLEPDEKKIHFWNMMKHINVWTFHLVFHFRGLGWPRCNRVQWFLWMTVVRSHEISRLRFLYERNLSKMSWDKEWSMHNGTISTNGQCQLDVKGWTQNKNESTIYSERVIGNVHKKYKVLTETVSMNVFHIWVRMRP